MANLREDVFREVFRSGGIRSVSVAYQDARVVIRYTKGDGVEGVIHSKRGAVKLYRVETAFKFLRDAGVMSVLVDLQSMAAEQAALL